MIAYHFVGKTLRDGRAIPSDGVWLKETLPLNLCRHGLHASKHVADALRYAPGNTLCLVELAGVIIEADDKVVAQRRRILARFDATDLLRADARASALSVIHLWKAPAIVRQYLETGDEALRLDAHDAAHDAARAARAAAYATHAARAAAYDSAAAAAYDSAHAAANAASAYASAAAATNAAANRERLQIATDEKFMTIPRHAWFMREAT